MFLENRTDRVRLSGAWRALFVRFAALPSISMSGLVILGSAEMEDLREIVNAAFVAA